MREYYVAGDWNALCDRCGFQYKASKLREEWTGHRVCVSCWEPRHPQTLIREVTEDTTVPWARPEANDVFVNVGDPIYTETDLLLLTESGLPILTET